MNDLSIQSERAWQLAFDQLRIEMPKASFDTWVRDTRFILFKGNVFTIGTPNAYAREWLTGRLTSTLRRLLTGMLNHSLEVAFIVEEAEVEDDSPAEPDAPAPEQAAPAEARPSVLSLQAEYRSIYDEIVQPDQVIVVPGYFMHYIPLLGVELAWLYIGFRQAAYEADATRQPGK